MTEINKQDIEYIKQPTKEEPFIVESYPYGYKRTKAKYYIETSNKGQRLVFQTLNPTSLNWNNEKKGTYSDLIIGYVNKLNGHFETYNLNMAYSGAEELKQILELFNLNQLGEYAQKKLKYFEAIIQTRKHIKVEISETFKFSSEDMANPTPEFKQKYEEHLKRCEKLEEHNKDTMEKMKEVFKGYYAEGLNKPIQI